MRKENEILKDPASFRDPASRVYAGEYFVIREIYPSYFKEYDHFMRVVYPELIDRNLIVPHKELSRTAEKIIIAPERVDFISYPYEWNFDQLKEAALTTLAINNIALAHGMMLKDASAYNIQFHKDHWRLIDTCSFMFYQEVPWPAYAQFLRHFITPMLLIKYFNPSLSRLSEIYLDGIPVPLAARLLPWSTKFTPSFWVHIYSQVYADLFKTSRTRPPRQSTIQLIAFLGNLYHFVVNLKYKPLLDSGWLKYAEADSYTPDALKSKRHRVKEILSGIQDCRRLLDLGSNTGEYSRIAANKGWSVIAVDSDHDCMFRLNNEMDIFPLVVDLCNPPPAIGWANTERRGFWDRIGKVDCILALALIHHLAIRNNVPLGMIADLLADYTRYLIIEWIPPDDKQAVKLRGLKNIPEYNQATFIDEFSRRFYFEPPSNITGSNRQIYLMESK